MPSVPLKKAGKLFKVLRMGLFVHSDSFVSILMLLQIPLDATLIEAAKSSIVYSVTRQVSTPGKAVRFHLLFSLLTH